MYYKTLRDLNICNKKILVRVDLNLPTVNGKVTDVTRIKAIVPTINYIISNNGTPILMSHYGRPKGKYVESLSLKHIIPSLESVLNKSIILLNNPKKEDLKGIKQDKIVLLENLRFNPGEEQNDISFSQKLADLGDFYVNDAFSASHRSHSSTDGLAKLLPSFMGFSMEAELKALGALFQKPTLPLTAIIGGSKISSKLDLINNLIKKVDHLIVGGGMANTFLKAQNFEIGKSLNEKHMNHTAKLILENAKSIGCKVHLPHDLVTANDPNDTMSVTLNVNQCPENKMILDAGPATIKNIESVLLNSKTLLWNGPLGAFEFKPYDSATNKIASFVAKLTKAEKIISVAGGGDTIAALNQTHSAKKFTYVSTAGGAFLEWLEGKSLPGLEALSV